MKHDYTRTSSVTNMLTDLKWDTMQKRRINTRTTMFFRILHNRVDIEPEHPLINDRSNRGHNQRLSQIRTRTAIFQNSFPATVVFWNKLPQVVVDQTSLIECFQNSSGQPKHCIKPDVFIFFNSGIFYISVSPACCVCN